MKPGDGDPVDDDDLARLLQGAGERLHPDARVQAEVRAAVESEWRMLVAARERRRTRTVWAVAAGVSVAAFGLWLARPLFQSEQPVATLARMSGTVELKPDGSRDWTALRPGATVGAGDEIRTAGTGRAAFTLPSGIEVRLDRVTRFVVERVDRARLEQGGLFVDTHDSPGHPSGDLVVLTESGSVRHVGTQYLARVEHGELSVAVREGRVLVDAPAGPIAAAAGEQIVVTGDGVANHALSRDAAAWDWLGSIAPPFAIDGRPLSEFLEWAAHETGRRVVYETPDLEHQADGIVLRGSVAGLEPNDAIVAVGATTRLSIVVDDRRIEVKPATH
jgi:ferric-dicitrate binding protein FerR (iron transport regulator)